MFGFARRVFDAKKKNAMNKRDNNKYTFKTIMDHIENKMLTFNFFNQGIITLLMLVSQCGLHIQYSHYFGRISNVAKKNVKLSTIFRLKKFNRISMLRKSNRIIMLTKFNRIDSSCNVDSPLVPSEFELSRQTVALPSFSC